MTSRRSSSRGGAILCAVVVVPKMVSHAELNGIGVKFLTVFTCAGPGLEACSRCGVLCDHARGSGLLAQNRINPANSISR